VELTTEQIRVLACLIEKGATTPDNYPLSSNALTNACNQTTSREPVVHYAERDVDTVMLQLRELKLARTVTGVGHRVGKHKHIADEALGLDGRQLAVMAVLMLRGPQTVREIATRTERYENGPGGDVEVVDAAIDALAGRMPPLVERLQRRPGEREARVQHLLSDPDEVNSSVASELSAAVRATPEISAPVDDELTRRVEQLEVALREQTRRVERLYAELGLDEPE
jgi:uncharacterized protein YceH (UPF0502 family)